MDIVFSLNLFKTNLNRCAAYSFPHVRIPYNTFHVFSCKCFAQIVGIKNTLHCNFDVDNFVSSVVSIRWHRCSSIHNSGICPTDILRTAETMYFCRA